MARSRIIAGKAVIIIEAQNLVDKTLGKIRGNLHRFSNEMGKVGESLFRTGFFGAIASGVTVNAFVKFDDAMRTLRVNLDLFGKTAKQVEAVMGPLEERIRSLAKTTPFSPTEVAGAATELAKGGFEPKQIKESLQAVLDLSRATKSELGTSAEFVVRTMTTFGIATDKASEVVSQLVRASRKGTLSIDDLEAALRFSSGTADTLGVSLQKMLAIFTVLSNRGLVGSIAGTSTNTALAQLVKKAEELRDIGAIELVTGIREDGQEALDLIKTLENLFRYAETLPFVQQQTLFQDIFNLRGSRSITAIRKEMETIKNLTGFISDAGDEAAVAAKIMDEGIGGSLRRLFSTLQDVGIAFGQTVEQPIIRIASVIKGLLTELGKVAALNPALTSLVILSPGILLAAGAGMIALAKGLRVAAYSAGLLKGALGPVLRTISQGTVGQISAVSNFANNARRRRTIPQFNPTRETASRITTARETTTARRALIAQNQRNAVLGVQRQASAEKLLAVAERNRISSQAKLTASIKETTAARAHNAKLITQQQQRIQKAAGVYARQIELTKQLAQVENKLAFARTQSQLFPASARIFQRPLEEQRKALKAQIRGLNLNVGRGFQPITPLNSLNQSNRKLLELTKERTQLEKTASALGKGKVAIENRYIKQLTKGQDLLLDANKARQSITALDMAKRSPFNFQRGINAGLTTIKNFKFASLGKSVLAFGKTLQTVFTGIRRVFSTTGLLTVVEVLILFGDKIPIVSTVLERFGKAFGAAFKQIGDIAKYAAGPIALLKASIAAFSADNSELGMKGLVASFSLLGSIIKNQLVAAWAVFKQSLGNVYGILTQIASGFMLIFDSIVTSIRSVIDTVGGSISNYVGYLSRFAGMSGQGFSFDQLAGYFADFIESLTLFLSNLPILFASIIDHLGLALDNFTNKFEQMLRAVIPFANKETNKFIDPNALMAFSNKDEQLLAKQLTAAESDPAIKTLKAGQNFEEAFLLGIEKGFISSKFASLADKYIVASQARINQRTIQSTLTQQNLEKTRQDNIARAKQLRENITLPNLDETIAKLTERSQRLAQQGFEAAAFVQQKLKQTAQQATTDPGGAGNFPQEITQQNPAQHPLVRAMQTIADTLVGSAQSTQGNLLRAGKAIEERQLAEQEKTNEYLRKIAAERGILAMEP